MSVVEVAIDRTQQSAKGNCNLKLPILHQVHQIGLVSALPIPSHHRAFAAIRAHHPRRDLVVCAEGDVRAHVCFDEAGNDIAQVFNGESTFDNADGSNADGSNADGSSEFERAEPVTLVVEVALVPKAKVDHLCAASHS